MVRDFLSVSHCFWMFLGVGWLVGCLVAWSVGFLNVSHCFWVWVVFLSVSHCFWMFLGVGWLGLQFEFILAFEACWWIFCS